MKTALLVNELKRILGDTKVFGETADLQCYSYDSSFESHIHPHLPDAVVIPRAVEDAVKTVRFAAENGIPVTPRGAATGQACGSVPVKGGIVVDMSQLNQVIELDSDNSQIIVQPGIVHNNLNEFLAKSKLIFPPDPGSTKMCTLGGMVANNSRGMRALKYGATGVYVLGLQVVLPSGEVIQTGSINSRAIQSSSGLDLTKLYVGSEGILGIMTELRLRVMPVPEHKGLVVAGFDRLEDAGLATLDVFRACILPSAIEILDGPCTRALNLYRPSLKLPEVEAILLFELDGNKPSVECDIPRVAEIARRFTDKVVTATEPQEVATLWEARSVVGVASAMVKPGATRVYAGEDICVPIVKVPEVLRAVQDLGRKYDTVMVTYGHIGNGNMHTAPIADISDPDQVQRIFKIADEIHQLALRVGGTVTGEHGVGLTRLQYMRQEHGAALDAMWAIKRALDPQGIMNPGKLLPNE